jgi:2-hydroxy-3-keto-5-methylthiopentenyl-1-phosphate phosphatase
LKKFAKGNWQIYDRQLERGEITLEDCMKKQVGFLKASKKEILNELKNSVKFRPNFEELCQYCQHNLIPLIIASAGLDFVIEYFLKSTEWCRCVMTCTAKTHLDATGWTLKFPDLLDKRSANFKHDLVKSYKKQGRFVVYIGDGAGDYAAAAEADRTFAIRGSKLASLCKNNGIPFVEMTDFRVVLEGLREMTS